MEQAFIISNYYFNPYAIPTLVTGLLVLFLGRRVFVQRTEFIVRFSFLLLCVMISCWLLGLTAAYSSRPKEVAAFWYHGVVLFGVTLSAPSFYFLSVAFLKKLEQQKWIVTVNFILGVIFFICNRYYVTDFKDYFWGWYTSYASSGYVFFAFFSLLILLSARNFLQAYRKATSPLAKEQLKYVLVGTTFLMFGALDFLPAFGVPWYAFGYIPVTLFIVIFFYAIHKHRLFLRTSSVAAEAIIKTMADSLVVFDLDGNILLVNPVTVRLLGREDFQLMGKPARELFLEKDMFENMLASLVSKHDVKQCEMTYLTRTGGEIPVSLSISTVQDEKGIPAGFVCIAHDIRRTRRLIEDLQKAYAELQTAQKKLLQSEKMASIGQLAAGVAHEINNPTGFILSNLDVLEQYVVSLERVLVEYGRLEPLLSRVPSVEISQRLEELDAVKEAARLDTVLPDMTVLIKETIEGALRVKRIVQDLRTFSHMNQETQEYASINSIIDFALNIVGNELRHKADLVKEYQEVPLLLCYPQELGQVFVNLLINAIQALEAHGVITVRTYLKDEHVFIEIADTGSGMSAETAKHLFEPFFTTKPVGQGTGLGLSVAYGIIQRHNGEISARSEEGKGTTFTISLPCASKL